MIYKAGRENKAADELSPLNEEGELLLLFSYPTWEDGSTVIDETHQDPKLQQIITDLHSKTKEHPGFIFIEGVLLFKGRWLSQKPPNGFLDSCIARGVS